MAPKRKGRKKKNGTAAEKKLKLKLLIDDYDCKVDSAIEGMEIECEQLCNKIREKYDLALLDIPEKFRNLTLEEYHAAMSKTPPSLKPEVSVLSALQTRFKCMTERKALRATLSAKAKSSSKKSSANNAFKRNTGILSTVSKSSVVRPKLMRRPLASVQQMNTPLNTRKAALMVTPTSKNISSSSKTIVTPKFDPRLPLPNMLLRKPRANEVIMSLSGSPLQNPALSASEKPAVLVSVGGKVLNLAETSQLNSFDMTNIDSRAKETLRQVQEKLARMINN